MNLFKYLLCRFNSLKYINKCKIGRSFVHHCIFEGKNRIWDNCKISYTELGYGTYIGNGCKFTHAKIGRFCSISDDVVLLSGTHPLSGFVSTSPAFYSIKNHNSLVKTQKFNEFIRNDCGLSLCVGSDVWIGNRVLIKGGINIGNGAVIGMGAVVTKDVPDYAIVAGVPAHIIGYRHSDEERSALLTLNWWDKELNWIIENSESFSDIQTFLRNR